jgi:hypothetical protein
MGIAKAAAAHAAVLLLLLVVAIGAVRFANVSTDLIRAVPLVYFLYIAVVLIINGMKRSRTRGKRKS